VTDKHINEYEPQVRQLARERFTDREIARRLGLNLTAVQDLRSRFNIPSGSTPRPLTTAERADMVRASRGLMGPWSAKGGA
jgi:hypothetical protein